MSNSTTSVKALLFDLKHKITMDQQTRTESFQEQKLNDMMKGLNQLTKVLIKTMNMIQHTQQSYRANKNTGDQVIQSLNELHTKVLEMVDEKYNNNNSSVDDDDDDDDDEHEAKHQPQQSQPIVEAITTAVVSSDEDEDDDEDDNANGDESFPLTQHRHRRVVFMSPLSRTTSAVLPSAPRLYSKRKHESRMNLATKQPRII